MKMKKEILTLLVVFCFGCRQNNEEIAKGFEVIEIDSCEYILKYYDMNYFFTHKGNCKFCNKR